MTRKTLRIEVTSSVEVDLAGWVANFGDAEPERIARALAEYVTDGAESTPPWRTSAITDHRSTWQVASASYDLPSRPVTRWDLITDRERTAADATPCRDEAGRPLRCVGCGESLPTEGALARHFILRDRRFLNLADCPATGEPAR
ncbi:MAG: hypothetical protein ACRDXB_17570 [Actinomycetes bacterium]